MFVVYVTPAKNNKLFYFHTSYSGLFNIFMKLYGGFVFIPVEVIGISTFLLLLISSDHHRWATVLTITGTFPFLH